MSNNPPLPEPPADMSDLEATVTQSYVQPSPADIAATTVVGQRAPAIKNRARPRRGPQREPIFHRDDYRAAIVIIALSFPVGFLGAVLGILLMSHI